MAVPIMAQFSAEAPQPGGPEFHENVANWRVGQSHGAPHVVFGLNGGHLYAMTAPAAAQFCKELYDEAKLVAQRQPPTKQ
jgi:hypothetical protein